MKNPALRSCLLACALAASAGTLSAQTAATPATPAAATDDSEGVLKLEQFTVVADKTSGYRATNSITATGVGAKIADTPIAISVVTKELIDDTASQSLTDVLNYVPGVIGNPRSESTFTLRGFGGNIQFRNGQYRRQLLTTWNMDRAEVIKGPSSIFFGGVRPGGIINYVTAKPQFSGDFTTVKATVGSYGYLMGEVFHNQVVNDKLAIRVGVGGIDTDGERQFEYLHEYYMGASATWKPTPNQQVTLDLEGINRSNYYLSGYPSRSLGNSKVYGNPAAIAISNAAPASTTADTLTNNFLATLGYSTTIGAANFYPRYDMFTPVDYDLSIAYDATQRMESRTVDLDYLAKINDSLVWVTSLNYSFDDNYGIQPNSGDTTPFADDRRRFRVEEFINVRNTFNVHNKLTWRFDVAKTDHTVQIGQELQYVIFDRPGYQTAANAAYNGSVFGAFQSTYRPTGTPVGLRDLVAMQAAADVAAGRLPQGFNVTQKRTEIARGYFIVDQIKMFNERLFALLGVRYNSFGVEQHYDKPILTTINGVPTVTQDIYSGAKGGWTPQMGLLGKLTKDVSLYTTYSESIEPIYQLDADGNSSQPVESQSWDIGLKADVLDGRLSASIAYYDLVRENIAYRDTEKENATGRNPFYIYGQSESSKGIEIELNWSPINNYNLVVGWNHTTDATVIEASPTAQYLIGRRFGYVPENIYTVWNRYTFTSGPLKGFAVGLGLRHNDAAAASADPNNAVIVPAFTIWDAMISKKFRIGGRDYSAQFNVKNLTDELYRGGGDGFYGNKRQFMLSAQTRF